MRTAAAVLAALALATPAAAAPPRYGVLVPGTSLGGIRLDAPITAVLAAWGRSFGICRNCREPTWYFTYQAFQPQGVGVSFGAGRVRALFTVWAPPGWRSTDGIAIGDPVAKVTRVYGALDRTGCDGYDALARRRGAGITLFYVRDGVVWGFGLSRPGSPRCR